MVAAIVVLSIIIAIEALIIVSLFLRLKNRKKKYSNKMDRLYRSYNTAFRQMKGMEDLFNER